MNTYFESLWHFLSIPDVGLFVIGISALLASTILPFGSEPYYVAFLGMHPDQYIAAFCIASIANTLGGITTWYLGRISNRLVASQDQLKNHPKIANYLTIYGPKLLFFSWLPIIGDVIAGFAGWMKLPLLPCILYMLIGKSVRYMMITAAFLHFY